MGTLIDLNDWIEQRVNQLAQRYRRCRDTAVGKGLECELKEWGFKMAQYKTHYARTQREKENERKVIDK